MFRKPQFITKLVRERTNIEKIIKDGLDTEYEVAFFINDVSKPQFDIYGLLEKPVITPLLGRSPTEVCDLSQTYVEMMGLIGAGNNTMVGMTVAVAVSIQEAAEAGKF